MPEDFTSALKTKLQSFCQQELDSESEKKISLSFFLHGAAKSKQQIFCLNSQTAKYPASIVKLFWAVQALAELTQTPELNNILQLMLCDSSDKAGQQIVDLLCGQESAKEADFEKNYLKRLKLKQFWIKNGFLQPEEEFEVSHKTFLHEYTNFDHWIQSKHSANKISGEQICKLWYLIYEQSSSLNLKPTDSDFVLAALQRQPHKHARLPEEKFFQDSLLAYALPINTKVFCKSGWRGSCINDSGVIVLNTKQNPKTQFITYCVMTDLENEEKGIQFIRKVSQVLAESLSGYFL